MTKDPDRARRHTAQSVLGRIDGESVHQLMRAIDQPLALNTRLKHLDRQWDLDRAIETEAALTGLIGLALGVFVKRQLLAIPAVVGVGVLVFGSVGAYPLAPLLRRAGIRTSREIQRERFALKALRGDFSDLDEATLTTERSAQAPKH